MMLISSLPASNTWHIIDSTYGMNGRRQWQPTLVLLPGKSHGQRSVVGCSPWGCEKLDTTERLHFHFLLSCIGEGNGNPLQCSCLENPTDGGAWWAAIYGVAQSQTRLKRLNGSSSSSLERNILNVVIGNHHCYSTNLVEYWQYPIVQLRMDG